MDGLQIALIVVAIVLVLAIAGAVWMWSRQRRTRALRSQFGTEYENSVERYGSKGKAESELARRRDRVGSLEIVPLSREQYEGFHRDWERTQARFVDNPSGAVGEADGLVREVMMARGYPVADFEQRSADLSVEYPELVSNYRRANGISAANARGQASTEDLRDAVICYRELFNELLVSEGRQPANRREQRLERQREGRSRA